MKHTMRLMLVSAFTLLLATAAFAQTPEVSVLPVTEPLDVGGTILQPGTYHIRVMPSFTDRNKVQVLTTDGEVITTVLTVPHALEPNEEVPNTTFVYFPAGEGQPRALRTWFAQFPDASQGGHDIVYEESRATQLARIANADVVYYPEDIVIAEVPEPELRVITPTAEVETYTYIVPTPVVVETPAPMVSATETTELEMPATASNVPLTALLGLLAIAGAAVIRFRS